MAIIEDLWLQISPYFNLLHGSGNFAAANTQHQLTVDALRVRDEKKMERVIRADIDVAYRVLVNLVE